MNVLSALGTVVILLLVAWGCNPLNTADKSTGEMAGDTAGDVTVGPRCSDDPWIDVKMGSGMACGVHEGGCAECWGWEEWGDTAVDPPRGQDTGRWQDHNTQFPPEIPFESISLAPWRCFGNFPGAYSSCGLTESGQIVCWGPDDFGVPTDGNWSEVVVEAEGVCALDSTGFPQCWGQYWGSDGFAATPTSGLSSFGYECDLAVGLQSDGRPWFAYYYDGWAPSLPSVPMIRLDLGSDVACYEGTDHSVACVNIFSGENVPLPEQIGESGGPLRDLVVYDVRACMLTSLGAAVCWSVSSNVEGIPNTPTGDFVDLSCSWTGCCALTADGRAGCWDRDNNVETYRPPGSYTAL